MCAELPPFYPYTHGKAAGRVHCVPSKHFLKCGCTRCGSLVSARISSISSFDRKKNLPAHKFLSRAVNMGLDSPCLILFANLTIETLSILRFANKIRGNWCTEYFACGDTLDGSLTRQHQQHRAVLN